MRRFQRKHWVLRGLCLLGMFLCGMAGAANTNGNGVSLNLPATELPSGTVQSNDAGGRLASAETPSAGVVSANAAGAKVIVEPMNAIAGHSAPAAGFSASPLTGNAPLEVQFTDLSASGLYVTDAWSWDFGDGSTPSTEQNPKHTYMNSGKYSVVLTISTSGGSATVTKTDYITVTEELPAASPAGWILLACTVGMLGIRRAARTHAR